MKKMFLSAIFLLTALSMNAQAIGIQKEMSHQGLLVEIGTDHGEILVKLYEDTPIHTANFIKLAQENFYEGILFHRVIKNFMIQAGDPKSRDASPEDMLGDGSLGYTLPAEFVPERFHKRGALCAARMGDQVNPKKESSSCQFYIVQGEVWDNAALDKMEARFGKKFTEEQRKVYTSVGGTPFLDGEYTVFGEVLEGMEVVDKISMSDCDKNDRPREDVRITYVRIVK